jgi:cytoskeleton protein RodZ
MAYGVKKKGRIMTVSGIPPIRVILGAPQNVEIDFGGQPVDMTVHPAGRSANFKLPVVGE